MSKSRQSLAGKLRVSGALLLVAIGCITCAFAFSRLESLAIARSGSLLAQAQAAESSDPARAELLYRQAAILNPHNSSITDQIADMYVRLNQPDRAVSVLRETGREQDNIKAADIWLASGQIDAASKIIDGLLQDKAPGDAWTLKSKLLLEQGKGDESIQAAKQGLGYDVKSQPALLQLGLSLAVGKQFDQLGQLISANNASPASQSLSAAATGDLPLARLLYAQRLVRSSERVLLRQAELNDEGYLLLARIRLSLDDSAGAKDYLANGLRQDPANLEMHQLLKTVYDRTGDPAAAQEQELINRLRGGKV